MTYRGTQHKKNTTVYTYICCCENNAVERRQISREYAQWLTLFTGEIESIFLHLPVGKSNEQLSSTDLEIKKTQHTHTYFMDVAHRNSILLSTIFQSCTYIVFNLCVDVVVLCVVVIFLLLFLSSTQFDLCRFVCVLNKRQQTNECAHKSYWKSS